MLLGAGVLEAVESAAALSCCGVAAPECGWAPVDERLRLRGLADKIVELNEEVCSSEVSEPAVMSAVDENCSEKASGGRSDAGDEFDTGSSLLELIPVRLALGTCLEPTEFCSSLLLEKFALNYKFIIFIFIAIVFLALVVAISANAAAINLWQYPKKNLQKALLIHSLVICCLLLEKLYQYNSTKSVQSLFVIKLFMSDVCKSIYSYSS